MIEILLEEHPERTWRYIQTKLSVLLHGTYYQNAYRKKKYRVAPQLKIGYDYDIDPDTNHVYFTLTGLDKIRKIMRNIKVRGKN